jgi:hypothetical protein
VYKKSINKQYKEEITNAAEVNEEIVLIELIKMLFYLLVQKFNNNNQTEN